MATAEQPRAVRAINTVGGLLSRVGVKASLDPDSMHKAAVRKHKLEDFGDTAYLEGLHQLVESLENEANLTTIGRISARQTMMTGLEHRLLLTDWRKHHPEVAEEKIERPIFVLGLPRTGTTVLFGMLAANPALRSPVSWEVTYPSPPPRPEERANDPRIATMRKQYDDLRRIAPGVDAIHPVGEFLPQECIAMHTIEFASYQHRVTFPVQSYFNWMRDNGIKGAYEAEYGFLQHLQSRDRRDRWLLKSPANLMWLDNLLEVFPDALIVHTHRDPAKVLPSVSSLYELFWNAVSHDVDSHEIGATQLDEWTWGLEQAMKARERIPAERVIDVAFEETLTDPVGTMRRVYEHFDMEVTPAAEAGVQAYLEENSRDKHGTHTYDLAHFGLDRDEVHEQFADYIERFDVKLGL